MVSLKFKVILVIFFALVLLIVSAPGVKANCGPYTCSCTNAFGWVACKAVCSDSHCGADCDCGFFKAHCIVWQCVPATSYTYQTVCSGRYVLYQYMLRSGLCDGYKSCEFVNSSWTTYSQTYCGSSYYQYQTVCSGSNVLYQQRLVSKGCSGGSCYSSTGSWTTYSQTYCGSSYYQYQTVCSGSNVLYQRRLISRGCSGGSCYTNTGSWVTYSQTDCSTSYYEYQTVCSGSNVLYQRRLISRGCSGSSCYSSTGSWTTYSQTDCSTSYYEYRCSTDGQDVEKRLTSGGCSEGSCYGSTGSWTNYQDCGIDSCGSWSSNYCEDNDVYHSRICYDRGCANEACYENPSAPDEEKVQECGLSAWTDEYQCSGDWRQKKWINRGCSGSSCYVTEEWKDYQDCSLTCFPGILGQGCRGGTYTCQDGTCGSPLQSCSPPLYTSSGVACECDNEQGTMIKSCNGSGSCLNVEKVCDVDCGADLVCQGLKPGDEYPGDSSKICCKGEANLPLPEWYEVAP